MSQAQQAELHSTLKEKYKDIVSLNAKEGLRQPLFNTHKRSYSTSKNASFQITHPSMVSLKVSETERMPSKDYHLKENIKQLNAIGKLMEIQRRANASDLSGENHLASEHQLASEKDEALNPQYKSLRGEMLIEQMQSAHQNERNETYTKQSKTADTVLGLQSEAPSIVGSLSNLPNIESFGKLDGSKAFDANQFLNPSQNSQSRHF